MPDNLISQVTYIVIHCSDDKFKLHNALDIHKLHLSFGWDGIGFTKLSKKWSYRKWKTRVLDRGTCLWIQ